MERKKLENKGWLFRNLVKPFLPRYEVVFRLYQIIPGEDVKFKNHRFGFGKGEREQAEAYFSKVVKSTHEFNLNPSEVMLVKGRKKIKSRKFGPVEMLNQKLNLKLAS
ncbi:hypothetical protein [Xanthovirga aplysinae]|uniref:hypothetical protein n=1 Tax=Xanthovirga aplysinae TaxID=2529853 RepID=UPI0012BD0D0F|nr:hypothetical protein [Xanthovirga aplysinae]MTI33460.1 hypothetical protein [Xanthovirga aplysinae]